MHDQPEISEALARLGPDTPSPVARDLLVMLGRHAAAGHAPPKVPAMAVTSLLDEARKFSGELTADTSGLADLEDRWHAAAGQEMADTIVTAPLAIHLDALYAVEAVESLAEASPENTAVIDPVAHELAVAFLGHDRALRSHAGVLCTLADGDAFKAWRRSLPASMDPIPWWLDGSLEAEAAALVRRTDSQAGRISAALDEGAVVLPMPQAPAAARAIRNAAGFRLAAATAAPAGLSSHSWRHPSALIEAILWVPATFGDGADLRMVFRGSAERREERDLVGEVVLLEGLPAIVRLEREGDAERVEASWPARDVAAVVRESLTLTDGRGRRWVPCG